MTTVRPIPSGFHKGEAVVLARGSYQGTPGIFLQLRADPAWADIQETNGDVRGHPVEWLERATKTGTV
jgi:hypothetical protein